MLQHAGLKEIVLWFLRRRRRFRVSGNSMESIFNDGDEILVKMIKRQKMISDANRYDRNDLRHGDFIVSEKARYLQRTGFLVVKKWDGKGLKSMCHQECRVEGGSVFGVVTSILR